jgi:outer membrane protein
VLGMLMHDPSVADVAVLDEIEAPLPPLTEAKEALIEQAKQKRYEIQVLRTMIRGNELSLDAYSADQLPKFLVGGSAELANPNQRYSSFEHAWNGSWALFAALAWSPNDYVAADKSQGVVRASLAQAQADIATLEDAIRIEVSQAYEDYKAAQAALDASHAAIAFAEESYRVRRAQFQAGAAVARDVIDAEAAQRQARLELVNAAIDVRIASVRLDRALER